MPESALVRRMFSGISPRYDLLNRLLSLGIDRGWRRRTVAALRNGGPEGPGRALDLCCGTGDLALELASGGFRVTGVDFCHEMLVRGRQKARGAEAVRLAEGDALRLPFPDGVFTAASVAFGIRNLQDMDAGLAEMARVLRPGGRLAVLEFGRPRGWLLPLLYKVYLNAWVPVVGRLVSGDRAAYGYLASSIQAFPDVSVVEGRLLRAGFSRVEIEPLTGGIAWLYLATKPGPDGL